MGPEIELFQLPSPDSGQLQIPITLKRSLKRKTWSLAVNPGGEVVLSVPFLYPQSKINELLKKHQPWIQKRFKKYSKVTRIDLSQPWTEGNSFYFRGQELKLKFSRAFYPSVSVVEDHLLVNAPDFKSSTIKKAVELWLEENTFQEAQQYLQKWAPRFSLGKIPPLKLRLLKRSWGQCRSDGRITLHSFLGRLHPEFFEYVVVHEMCHLFHMNHGPAFKALLTWHIPHWKEIKKKHEPIFY